jgi:hypothetical protein
MLKPGKKGAIPQSDKETYAIAPHIRCGVVHAALYQHAPENLRCLEEADYYLCSVWETCHQLNLRRFLFRDRNQGVIRIILSCRRSFCDAWCIRWCFPL